VLDKQRVYLESVALRLFPGTIAEATTAGVPYFELLAYPGCCGLDTTLKLRSRH